MKIIYSDENLERMNKAKEIADSTIFHDYINNNINQALKWEYGMFRVQSYELRKLIEAYYRRYNFIFGKDIKHDY